MSELCAALSKRLSNVSIEGMAPRGDNETDRVIGALGGDFHAGQKVRP